MLCLWLQGDDEDKEKPNELVLFLKNAVGCSRPSVIMSPWWEPGGGRSLRHLHPARCGFSRATNVFRISRSLGIGALILRGASAPRAWRSSRKVPALVAFAVWVTLAPSFSSSEPISPFPPVFFSPTPSFLFHFELCTLASCLNFFFFSGKKR